MGMKALKIFEKKIISMQSDIVVNPNWKLMLNMKFGVHSKSSCLKVAFLTWKIQLKMLWKHDQVIHDLKLDKITLSMKKVFQDAYKSIYTSQLLNLCLEIPKLWNLGAEIPKLCFIRCC